MAGMFCSVEEAAQRLGKTEDEIKELMTQGVLREFRDGPNLLLKVDEIEEVARNEGIDLPAEVPAQEMQVPEQPATIPTELHTEPEEDEMKEPDMGDLDSLEDADLDLPELEPLEPVAAEEDSFDIPELDALDGDMADLDMPDLAPLDAEEAPPALAGADLLADLEEPPAEEEKPGKKSKAKGKKKKKQPKPKLKKQPKARPVKVHARSAPSQSFGEWFAKGLRNDSLAAIVVLIILLAVIVGVCVGIGFGANYAMNNLL